MRVVLETRRNSINISICSFCFWRWIRTARTFQPTKFQCRESNIEKSKKKNPPGQTHTVRLFKAYRERLCGLLFENNFDRSCGPCPRHSRDRALWRRENRLSLAVLILEKKAAQRCSHASQEKRIDSACMQKSNMRSLYRRGYLMF